MSEPNQQLQRIDSPQTLALDAAGRKSAIDDLLNKVALVQEVMSKVMHEGEHFGKIPGCGDKNSLFKSGAEKLGMTFRLKATFEINERDLGHANREYSVRCLLSDGNMGVGSCSTMESKYRYRSSEYTCPACGKATIRKSKVDERHPKGGFYCWSKLGGCGVQFDANDERITEQKVGKVEHDNPADFYNTCLKMAKKRAHVDAIITATACSDIFTQDVEDLVQNATAAPPSEPGPSTPKQEPKPSSKTEKPKAETFLPRVTIKMVSEKTGTKKDGTPWTAYFILLNDGIGDIEVGTFSKTLAGIARQLEKDGIEGEATIKDGNKPGTKELVNLLATADTEAEPTEVPGVTP